MFTTANNRTYNIFLIIALAITLVVILALTVAPSAAAPVNADAYLQFRRGEWTSSASAQQAYLDQRHGEQMAGPAMNSTQIYLSFRKGEWAIDPTAAKAFLDYRRGEWTGN